MIQYSVASTRIVSHCVAIRATSLNFSFRKVSAVFGNLVVSEQTPY
eukprot:COSAG02_NODE_9884_length_2083_cov_12.694556_3_plen_45_part_01